MSRTRKLLCALLLIGAAAGASLLIVLKVYAVELVHAVVENKVIQRLPEGYSQGVVRGAFRNRLVSTLSREQREIYLEDLKAASIQLEKVQFLEPHEVEEILEIIRGQREVPE